MLITNIRYKLYSNPLAKSEEEYLEAQESLRVANCALLCVITIGEKDNLTSYVKHSPLHNVYIYL